MAASGNAEQTRLEILEAALVEFSLHGAAGARIDRIAAAAGCNKNLIYVYFGGKESLFNTVLRNNLTQVYDELPFAADDLADYAARLFDLAMSRPDLMRLLVWSTLEQQGRPLPERAASQRAKAAAIAAAQQDDRIDDRFPPAFLLTATMALATAWSAAATFGSLDPDALADSKMLRQNVATAVQLIIGGTGGQGARSFVSPTD